MFLKSLLLGIRRKVGEPILIILTVAISVAIFVSALALRASIKENAIASYRALSGSCELEAAISEENDAYYLTTENERYRILERTSQKYGELRKGYLFYASIGGNETFAQIYATDISALPSYNPIRFSAGEASELHTGVILKESFAEEHGLHVGDFLPLSRYGTEKTVTLTVTGIAKEEGIFVQADALVSDRIASRLLSLGGEVQIFNRIFLDLSEEKMKAAGVNTLEEVVADLDGKTKGFELGEPVNEVSVAVMLSSQSIILLIIAGIVAVLGFALIYTAVSLVLKNRVSTAALFKSVGAESGKLGLYLLTEVFLYGIVGSILGLAGSYGFGALFAVMTGASGVFTVEGIFWLYGILFGVALSLASALIPVIRLAYAPLGDLLRAHSPILSVKHFPAIVVGALFVVIFTILPFMGVAASLAVGVAAAVLLFACLFTLMPVMIGFGSHIVCSATRDISKAGSLYLAATGARSNRHAQSAARLLSIAITAVVTIAILLGETNAQIRTFENLFRSEIMVVGDSESLKEIAEESRSEEGASGSYLAFVETRCALEGVENNTVTFFAARAQDYSSVFNLDSYGVEPAAIAGDHRLAVSGGIALKLGVGIGDKIGVRINGKMTEFTVAVLMDTPLSIVFTDLGGLGENPNTCFVDGDDALFRHLAEKYALKAAVYHPDDVFAYVLDRANAYVKVFTLFSVLVILFAIGGYLLCALETYRDRKREYALLRSVGADKGQIVRIVLFENGLIASLSVLMGAIFSIGLLFIVQNMLKSLGYYFVLFG